MRRLLFFALLALAVFAVPAVAQTTDSTTASASCADPDDSAGLMVASASDDGGVAADPTGSDAGSSGGTPAVYDGGTPDTTVGDAASVAGDTATGSDTPGAVVAQEPEPEPEGPGEEQPGDPGAQPPPVDTPEVPGEAPAEQAPGGETGGGLPQTGLEALQLALLGVVLFLVGARIRVVALRRRKHALEPTPHDPRAVRRHEAEPSFDEDFDDDFDEPAPLPTRHTADRDEWSFPDPSEPAPTGLLPSTASARRQAREPAMAGDPE
jgi:hypothetical protein